MDGEKLCDRRKSSSQLSLLLRLFQLSRAYERRQPKDFFSTIMHPSNLWCLIFSSELWKMLTFLEILLQVEFPGVHMI